MTSIQKFLGHKKLNTTMIYARALDKTVAEDYFKAMQQVEQQLSLSFDSPNQHASPGEILALVETLFSSPLNLDQTEIVSTLRFGLALMARKETAARVFRIDQVTV